MISTLTCKANSSAFAPLLWPSSIAFSSVTCAHLLPRASPVGPSAGNTLAFFFEYMSRYMFAASGQAQLTKFSWFCKKMLPALAGSIIFFSGPACQTTQNYSQRHGLRLFCCPAGRFPGKKYASGSSAVHIFILGSETAQKSYSFFRTFHTFQIKHDFFVKLSRFF